MDIRDFRIVGQQALAKDNARHPWSHSDHFHAWILRRRQSRLPVSVGDADVRVHGRRIVEQREHAGGEVGAGDAEAVWQVAVSRGAVGSPGGLAGERGRAEDCPVQVAGVDLVLGAVEVGADVAEERAPDQGLEQVAQVRAFALIGDDGAWMMLRVLSWRSVDGPVPGGATAVSTASAPSTAGVIEAGSRTSAVTTSSRGWAGTARRAGRGRPR